MKFESALESEKVIFYNDGNSYLIFKRIMDFIISLIALVTLSPILLIISLIIKLDSDGPVIYKNYRLGKNGKVIGVYKFRTMVKNADEVFRNFTKEQKEEYEKFFKLENDPRITRIGDFLRKTSLDELPQILNILKGEVSIIGPRPVVLDEIKKFGNLKDKYLSVLPGLTGWWACNGRSSTTYEERINLEMYYIDNQSLKLDIECFFKTILAVFKRNGAM